MKVAVVGVNGTLGPPVLTNLLSADHTITILTRDAAKTSSKYPAARFPAIRVEQTDYSSVSAVAGLLRGHDAVVSLINRNQLAAQNVVTDATAAAGVPHLIPSSFGVGRGDEARLRAVPTLADKYAMEDHVAAVAARHDPAVFAYTMINQSLLLDWGLGIGTPIALRPGATTFLYDGGDKPQSVTTLDALGRAVAAVLVAHRPAVANRSLCIHNAVVSQNQLLRLATRLRSKSSPSSSSSHAVGGAQEWPVVVHVDTAALHAQAQAAWDRGERNPVALRGFLVRVSIGEGYGAFADDDVDNELLGVERFDEDRIVEVMRRFV